MIELNTIRLEVRINANLNMLIERHIVRLVKKIKTQQCQKSEDGTSVIFEFLLLFYHFLLILFIHSTYNLN